MLNAETIPATIFLGLVSIVYVHAFLASIRWLSRKSGPTSRGLIWDRTSLALATIGIVCMAYGYFVEPNRLTKTHVSISSPKIPHDTGPKRIVQLSDLHSDPTPRLEQALPDAVA